MTSERFAAWLVETCLMLGAAPMTAYRVAALFTESERDR